MNDSYLTAVNLIYLFFNTLAFMTGLLLFISFIKEIKPFIKPAFYISLGNIIIKSVKFIPGIYNRNIITGNPEYFSYVKLELLTLPYEFIKLFIFISVGMFLFKTMNITPFNMKIKDRGYWIDIVVTFLIFIIITESLIFFIKPDTTETGRKYAEMMLSIYNSQTLGSFHIAMGAPLGEELTYRFFGMALLLHGLRKNNHKWIISILFTSLIWSFGHTGMLVPEWVKFVQIFIYGLMLGYLFKKRGIEATVISHLVANTLLTVIHLGQNF